MNMKKKWQNISVRYRYRFSFLIAAIVPIGLILFSFYHYNIGELRKDTNRINMNRVSQIQSNIEAKILGQYKLAGSLSGDQQFLSLVKRGAVTDNYAALLIFREYLSYRNMNQKTAIFVPSHNVAYTKSGCSSYANYCTNVLNLDITQSELLFHTVQDNLQNSFTEIIPLTNSNGEKFIICAYSMPGYTHSPSAILFAILDTKELYTELFPLIESFSGSAFILNSQMELIFKADGEEPLSDEIFPIIEEMNFTQLEGQQSLDFQGKPYSILYSRSDSSGLTYGVVSLQDNYATQIIKQTTLIWQVALFALLFCILIVVLLTMFNYFPVKRLMELIGISSHTNGYEYRMIQQAIIEQTTHTDHLEEIIALQRPYILERILSYALYSETTPEQLCKLLESIRMRFQFSNFFVLNIHLIGSFNNSDQSIFKDRIIALSHSLTSESCCYYPVERFQKNEMVVVANCSRENTYRENASVFRDHLLESLDSRLYVVIGVSGICKKADQLKEALYEASLLAENCQEQSMAFSDDAAIQEVGEALLYPVKDVTLLQLQLRQGDEANASATFQKLYSLLCAETQSLLYFKYQSSYILNAIAEVLQQQPFYSDFVPVLHKLIQAHHPEDFQKETLQLISDLCSKINEGHRNSDKLLCDRMLEYIQLHISDVNLGLEQIAEEFGYSTYYVSRFFREQNNENLKEYISTLRLERAKVLLKDTQLSVNEIVEKVGYISPSSFIRKFKVAEGMTPGEYRRMEHISGKSHMEHTS